MNMQKWIERTIDRTSCMKWLKMLRSKEPSMKLPIHVACSYTRNNQTMMVPLPRLCIGIQASGPSWSSFRHTQRRYSEEGSIFERKCREASTTRTTGNFKTAIACHYQYQSMARRRFHKNPTLIKHGGLAHTGKSSARNSGGMAAKLAYSCRCAEHTDHWLFTWSDRWLHHHLYYGIPCRS
jgi:hypothetical protein